MSKRIAILGSTGSIGCNALQVIQHLGPPYRAVALSAHKQTDKLINQVRQHRPTAIALTGNPVPDELRSLDVEVLTGEKSVLDYIVRPARTLRDEALRER